MAKKKKPGTELAKVETGHQLQPGEESIEEKRASIYQNANPALRKQLDKIQEWFDVDARHSIKVRWELALQIKAIYDDVTEHRGNRYGVHAIDQIRAFFGWDGGVIYSALRIAKQFTQEEIDDLCGKKMPNGQPLSYSHLNSLMGIQDRDKRKELIDKAVEENWTSNDLARAVVQGKEPARLNKEDRRGRPIGKPRNFDLVLAQMEAFADDFLGRAKEVWTTEQHSLDGKMTDFANDDFTVERAGKVKTLAGKLLKVSEMAKTLEQMAVRVHGVFVKIQKETTPKLKIVGSKESEQKAPIKGEHAPENPGPKAAE